MTHQEIKKELSNLRKEMKARGIRKICSWNGGLSSLEKSYNSRRFMLETELDRTKNGEASLFI